MTDIWISLRILSFILSDRGLNGVAGGAIVVSESKERERGREKEIVRARRFSLNFLREVVGCSHSSVTSSGHTARQTLHRVNHVIVQATSPFGIFKG